MTGPRTKDAWTHSAVYLKRWVILPYFIPQFQALPDLNIVTTVFGTITVQPYEYTEWLRQSLQDGSLSQAWGIFLEGLGDIKPNDGSKLW
jgi:hypothetical protein